MKPPTHGMERSTRGICLNARRILLASNRAWMRSRRPPRTPPLVRAERAAHEPKGLHVRGGIALEGGDVGGEGLLGVERPAIGESLEGRSAAFASSLCGTLSKLFQ
jgi:hypothetical protein